jgi:hypothetical protein
VYRRMFSPKPISRTSAVRLVADVLVAPAISHATNSDACFANHCRIC